MSLLLKHSTDDESVKWTEDHMQIYAVKFLRRHPAHDVLFTFAADQNEGKRSVRDGQRRKALGMVAGEPDLRFYIKGGKLGMIEAKRKGNYASKAQKERIILLQELGFDVRVVTGRTPEDFKQQVLEIFEEWLEQS